MRVDRSHILKSRNTFNALAFLGSAYLLFFGANLRAFSVESLTLFRHDDRDLMLSALSSTNP